ncbi:transposase domain-containing protein [Streptomyces sp. NPDC002790]|uniref:transposase domain-containing protein n=1 Tax=Streptomyces sp. NPDC002790 TaxID=3154431 RepID=UPI003332B078
MGGYVEVGVGVLMLEFPVETVTEVLEDTDRCERRRRSLPAHLMVYFTLAMWLYVGVGYVQVLDRVLLGMQWARGEPGRWTVAGDAAITRARQKLGSEPLRQLFYRSVADAEPDRRSPGEWRGRRVLAFDRMELAVANNPENRARYGNPSGSAGTRVRLAVLARCGDKRLAAAQLETGAGLDAGTGTERTSLVAELGSGVLLLGGDRLSSEDSADRKLGDRDWFAVAAAAGAALVWEVRSTEELPRRYTLADGSYLSEFGESRVVVRVVESAGRSGRGDHVPPRVVTTLLDPTAAPAAELVRLCAYRWTSDVMLRTLNVPSDSSPVLRSRHPENIEQEIWAMLCAYQALSRLITPTAWPTAAGTEQSVVQRSVSARQGPQASNVPASWGLGWPSGRFEHSFKSGAHSTRSAQLN